MQVNTVWPSVLPVSAAKWGSFVTFALYCGEIRTPHLRASAPPAKAMFAG